MADRTQFFRASAGVVVVGRYGKILAFERRDVEGAFQLAQGGIEAGETPLAAARRELSEESGIPLKIIKSRFQLVQEHPEWLTYLLPPRRGHLGLGQTQKWFLMNFGGHDQTLERHIDLNRSAEFKSFRWTTLAQLTNEVIWWRKPIYHRLQTDWAQYLSSDLEPELTQPKPPPLEPQGGGRRGSRQSAAPTADLGPSGQTAASTQTSTMDVVKDAPERSSEASEPNAEGDAEGAESDALK